MICRLDTIKVLFDERVFRSLPRIVLPCGTQFEPLWGTRFIISEYSRHLFLACLPLCNVITYVSHILIPYLISDCRSCSSERKDFLYGSWYCPGHRSVSDAHLGNTEQHSLKINYSNHQVTCLNYLHKRSKLQSDVLHVIYDIFVTFFSCTTQPSFAL